MSQQYPSRIRYEYEQDPETRLQYTHGVWGASTRKAKSKSASISKATRCRRTPNVS